MMEDAVECGPDERDVDIRGDWIGRKGENLGCGEPGDCAGVDGRELLCFIADRNGTVGGGMEM